ncbi:Uncharacterized protein dnl_09600 [Desulfonema limicola]|uniref:Uncharacterized protein n=1 Tax=Desulfonema limicola TaxID=45656 RepID=A0A975B4N2_9BACT|nr:hypothetical protein [Desulfonema limicola]QTA78728.1 Uncharacterized protein dnl_09600 [Desulfonema limicola]
MSGWQHDRIDCYPAWIQRLEQFNVFFSYPLDLDLSMLSAFLKNYMSIKTVQRGPNIPSENSPGYNNYMQNAGNEVLGKENMFSLYDLEGLSQFIKIFPWYRYLFSKSKPATHLFALNEIDTNDLKSNAPEFLKKLLNKADKAIKN